MKVRIFDYQSLEKLPVRCCVKYKHKHKLVVTNEPCITLYKGRITQKGVTVLQLQDVSQ
jgi:hypothetical protein